VGSFGDELTDAVVLTVRRPRPVPWLELHCHGGREVVRLLQSVLEARGAVFTSWHELERRATGDGLRAAAAAALAEARTTRTVAILLDQYQGAFPRAVVAVTAALDRGDSAEAGRLLEELARHANPGRHLMAGWRVVVAGAPNVGKSSLVNALAGYQRSVVSAIPGTTRDVVTTRIAVDGWPVELADTAGLRPEAAGLEEQGVRRAREAAQSADLILWVLDASAAPAWPADDLRLSPADPIRFVINKADLSAGWDLDRAAGAPRVSARTGAGLGDFCAAMARWLVPQPPPPGAAVPFTPSLVEQVGVAGRHCAAGRIDEARRVLRAMAEG
jgi:tRNA modification GTPase